MAPVAGHLAQLELCGATVAMTTETFTVIAGSSNQNWRITDSTKDIWDWGVTFTVEAEDPSTTWNTLGVEEFNLRYLTGIVEIDAYTSGSGNPANIVGVRITGNYLPKYVGLEARSAELELLGPMLNASVFGNLGERRIPGRADGSASFNELQAGDVPLDTPAATEERIWEMILNSTATVLSVQQQAASAEAFRMLVHIDRHQLSLPGGDVMSGTVNMTGTIQDPAMASQVTRIWDVLYY